MTQLKTERDLIGSSAAMQEIREELECAARSDARVLITGESGVGKEAIARLIHQRGRRRPGPFAAINCAGVPDGLLESELFGRARGSFTEEHRDARGWLEQANAGTLFLVEVGEMSLRMQAVLLRFLENGEIHPVGSNRAHSTVDVRIIAATSRKLHDEMRAGRFLEDLYYRLNVVHIVIPPLRERKDDVRLLIDEFLRSFSLAHQSPQPRLPDETLRALVDYSWPGNVRELKNVVERLVARARSGTVPLSDLPDEIIGPTRSGSVSTAGRNATPTRADKLFAHMHRDGESFWTVVYEPFMARDVTHQDLRAIVTLGLKQSRGNYKLLVQLFNVDPKDYKRFLAFLRKYECHLPFQRFRSVPVRTESLTARESGR